MFCPNRTLLHMRNLYIGRRESTDWHGQAPWRERLNPLRYHFRFGPAERPWLKLGLRH